MKVEDFFYRRPVFTNEELAQFLASRRAHGPRTQESLLAYYTKTGRVVRVRRGLYAVVPPGATPQTYSFDPFLLTAKMTKDAVLAYHTAWKSMGRLTRHTNISHTCQTGPYVLWLFVLSYFEE